MAEQYDFLKAATPKEKKEQQAATPEAARPSEAAGEAALKKQVEQIESALGSLASKSDLLKAENRLARIDSAIDSMETVDKAAQQEETSRKTLGSGIDEMRGKIKDLEKRDSVTIEQIYGGLREIDRLKRAIYPYAEEKNETLLLNQLKELERKVGNVSAVLASQQELDKRLDARLQDVEKKMGSVEAVVGRIDFPIDQLRNLFSILLDTNTQIKNFELELLTILKRVRKMEGELRERRFSGGSGETNL